MRFGAILAAAALACAVAWLAPYPACAAKAPKKQLVVYYFVTSVRCMKCYRMEEYTKEAVEAGFPKEIRSGRLAFRLVNVEEPANEHYWSDYKLVTKSVVVSDMRRGKERRFKVLPRTWELLGNKEEFVKYVRNEVKAFL